jgi:hypothetical protein
MTRLPLALLLFAAGVVAAAPVPKANKGPAYPYTVGTRWEYVRNGDPKKVYVEEVVESEEKDGVVTFKVDITTDAGGKMFERYTLKGGELHVTANADGAFDPPMLIRKDVMAAGDEWETTWGFKGEGFGFTQDETLSVGKAEELTTPAGKFTAFPITRKHKGGNGGTTMWYADGVGLIRHTEAGQKEPSQELKSFTRGKK